MRARFQILLFIVLTGFLFDTCKDTEVEPFVEGTQYYVVNNIQGIGLPRGNISTYDVHEAFIVDEAFKLSPKATSDWVADAVVTTDKLFIARAVTSSVEIVSLGDLSVLGSVNYGKAPTGNYYRHIEVTENRVVVADRAFLGNGTTDSESFLKLIHLDNLAVVDSVPIVANAAIWALAVANNRIFVSAGNLAQSITVIDAGTNVKVGEVPLPGLCSEMLVDKNNNILAFTRTRMLKINSTDLSVIKEWNLPSAQVNMKNQFSATCNSSHALDKETNVIYFLGVAAQPAPAPYLLYAYDINAEAATLLDANFLSGETISFDSKNKLIVIGDVGSATAGTGTVRMISPQGQVLSQFTLKNIPTKILVRP